MRTLLRRAIPAALAVAACATIANAQAPLPPPASQQRNPVCVRLESQLAMVDRGAQVDPQRAEQIKRYEDNAQRQQAELDRLSAQGRKLGCEGRGFFSLFGGQPQQCGPLNNQIQQMRANLDRILADLQRLQGNTADREGERRTILASLGAERLRPAIPSVRQSRRRRCRRLLRKPVRRRHHHHTRRADWRQRRHLSHRVRAHLRRLLFPDLLLDHAGELPAGRTGLPAPVPGGGGGALQPPQSRRGHFTGALDRRAKLFRTAERIRIPQGVQFVMQLPRAGPDLVPGAPGLETTRSSKATSSCPRSRRSCCRSRPTSAARAGPRPRRARSPRAHRRKRRPAQAPVASTPAATPKQQKGADGKPQVRTVGPPFIPSN